MIDTVLKIVAPHYCYSCGFIGANLCANCKNYIIDEPFNLCLSCLAPSSRESGLCSTCKRSYSMAWCAGEYSGLLKDCIHGLKFERNKQAANDLADLLSDALPMQPPDVQVTYVPTISSHRRQRGYDQSRLIASSFARRRKLKLAHTLKRVNNNHQLGASAKERWRNARTAYEAHNVNPIIYLLIDDVMTSGATLECASKALKEAGARDVWVACVARQTLD